MSLLAASGVRGGYGGADILNGADLDVGADEIVVVVGPNGAGKSTLAGPVSDGLRQAGENVVLLDGDELRAVFGPSATAAASHTRAARLDRTGL